MKITNIRWRLMLLLVFPLTVIMSLDRGVMAIIAPVVQKQFNFGLMEMSMIMTAFYWAYAPCNIPAGIFAQRFGPRRGMTIASGTWSAVTILMPFSMAIYPVLLALRFVLGAGQAVDWPASIGFINKWFTKTEKARASGILLGGLYAGTLIGKPLTAWIVTSFSWEWAFWSFGALSILFTWLWYAFIRDTPQEHALPNEAEKQYIAEGTSGTKVDRVSWSEWKVLLGKVQFWAIGLQYFFLIIIQSFYGVWLPTYLMATRKISLMTMGWVAAAPWLSMFISVFLFGFITDHVYKKTKSPVLARVPFAICGFVISAVFIYLGAVAQDIVVMTVCLMVSMVGIAMTQVTIWSACQDIGGPRAATLSGWVNFCGNMGNVVGPIATAFVVSYTGGDWASGLIVLAATGVLGAVLWLFVRPNRPLLAEPAA